MTDRTAEDDVLVPRARRGCAESIAAIVQAYQVPVVHYVGRLLARGGGSRARFDAEDVAQETLVRGLRGLDRYDPKVPFAAWLFTIARRTCLNHLRTERRHARRIADRGRMGIERCLQGPDDAAIGVELRQHIWDIAARALTEQQFTAVWLRYVEDMPVSGIARVLGTTPTAVKLHLFRGRRRLEPLFADAGLFVPPAANLFHA